MNSYVFSACKLDVNKASHSTAALLMAKIMEAMVFFARDTIAKTCRKSRKRKENLVKAITGQLDAVLHHQLAMWGDEDEHHLEGNVKLKNESVTKG